jgi:hypothetical protein
VKTLPSSPNVIGLREEHFGPSQLDLLDGQTMNLCGRAPARVNRFRKQDKGAVLMTNGICGPTWLGSSMEQAVTGIDLLQSWENRLRERLAMIGSTESALIWRSKDTGHGWSISRLAPWTPPTSGSGSTGSRWPTAQARDGMPPHSPEYIAAKKAEGHGMANLNDYMALTQWTTVSASDSANRRNRYAQGGSPLTMQMHQASPRVTPSSRDWKDTAGMATERPDGRSRIDQLPRQMAAVGAATWPTVQAADGSKGNLPPRPHDTGVSLPQRIAQTLPSGQTTTGSDATTEKRGAPNPAFPYWLMGFPDAWINGVLLAMQSWSPKRSKSLKRSGR